MAALFPLVVNFRTVSTGVGDSEFGFLVFGRRELVCVFRQASHFFSSSLWAGRVPADRTPGHHLQCKFCE